MTEEDVKLSRAEAFYTTLVVLTGLGALALAAVVLSLLQPESSLAADPDAPRAVLEAPVATRDLERAQLGRDVRDAMILLDARRPQLTRRGGHRDSGRGWLFRSEEGTYDASIASILDDLGILRIPDDRKQGFDILIHECNGQFAVLVPSTVPSAPEDDALWQASGCAVVEPLVWNGPVFVAMAGTR